MLLQSCEAFGIAEASQGGSKGWIQALSEGWGREARKGGHAVCKGVTRIYVAWRGR